HYIFFAILLRLSDLFQFPLHLLKDGEFGNENQLHDLIQEFFEVHLDTNQSIRQQGKTKPVYRLRFQGSGQWLDCKNDCQVQIVFRKGDGRNDVREQTMIRNQWLKGDEGMEAL